MHAPYAIIGDLSIVYGKTTKTACGKRVATTKLVKRDDTTCPDCVVAIQADREQAAEIRRAAESLR